MFNFRWSSSVCNARVPRCCSISLALNVWDENRYLTHVRFVAFFYNPCTHSTETKFRTTQEFVVHPTHFYAFKGCKVLRICLAREVREPRNLQFVGTVIRSGRLKSLREKKCRFFFLVEYLSRSGEIYRTKKIYTKSSEFLYPRNYEEIISKESILLKSSLVRFLHRYAISLNTKEKIQPLFEFFPDISYRFGDTPGKEIRTFVTRWFKSLEACYGTEEKWVCGTDEATLLVRIFKLLEFPVFL